MLIRLARVVSEPYVKNTAYELTLKYYGKLLKFEKLPITSKAVKNNLDWSFKRRCWVRSWDVSAKPGSISGCESTARPFTYFSLSRVLICRRRQRAWLQGEDRRLAIYLNKWGVSFPKSGQGGIPQSCRGASHLDGCHFCCIAYFHFTKLSREFT